MLYIRQTRVETDVARGRAIDKSARTLATAKGITLPPETRASVGSVEDALKDLRHGVLGARPEHKLKVGNLLHCDHVVQSVAQKILHRTSSMGGDHQLLQDEVGGGFARSSLADMLGKAPVSRDMVDSFVHCIMPRWGSNDNSRIVVHSSNPDKAASSFRKNVQHHVHLFPIKCDDGNWCLIGFRKKFASFFCVDLRFYFDLDLYPRDNNVLVGDDRHRLSFRNLEEANAVRELVAAAWRGRVADFASVFKVSLPIRQSISASWNSGAFICMVILVLLQEGVDCPSLREREISKWPLVNGKGKDVIDDETVRLFICNSVLQGRDDCGKSRLISEWE